MIKGAQKKMVVIRTRDSRFFEEAYFVMRKDIPDTLHNDGDIVAEANRIVRQSTDKRRGAGVDSALRDATRISKLALFGAGALLGGGITALLFLLL